MLRAVDLKAIDDKRAAKLYQPNLLALFKLCNIIIKHSTNHVEIF